MDGGLEGGLTELHSHVGSAVSPEIMWALAHSQGIKVRGKDYWQFLETITVRPGKVKSLSEYLELFNITELIQSSPEAMEKSTHSIVGGAYRKNLITRLELRFNPMLRNRGGERDLDHIILAALRGMDRAMLEYPVSAGMILMMDRRFSPKQNEVILEKAIKYRHRGVVGVDIAGPHAPSFSMADYSPLYERAKKAGLGLTVHAGETDDSDILSAVEDLGVQRMGHGIHSAWNPSLMKLLRDRSVTLELCPSSNLHTGAVAGKEVLREAFQRLSSAEVGFTINTDGPEMLQTSLAKERALLLAEKMLSEDQLEQCELNARRASFLR